MLRYLLAVAGIVVLLAPAPVSAQWYSPTRWP